MTFIVSPVVYIHSSFFFLLQTLIRYILKQDLPMSLDDSLTLAEAYKLPTSNTHYLYLIQLIAQGKVEYGLNIHSI